jgi:hypothetical protein
MAHVDSDGYPAFESKLELMQYLKNLHDSNESPTLGDLIRLDNTDDGAWADTGTSTYFADGDVK